MATEYKFDIYKALAAVDRRDGGYFAKLPEDERKDFKPIVFMRWVSGVVGQHAEDCLHLTNENVNPRMFDIAKEHPELIFRLAARWCGSGKVQKHEWVGMPKRRTASNKAWNLIADHYPEANGKEIDMLLRMHTRDSFAEFIDGVAIQSKDEVSELMRAYDKLDAKTTSGKTEEKPKPARKRKT